MKVIERYILRRVFVVFAGALFWTLAIVWTTQVLARIDLVTDSGQTALTFFEIATLMLPSIIPMVIPFALIIGIAQTLSTMNTDSELVVMSAAGTPSMTTIRPIILLALAASMVSFVVDNGVDPYARERSRQKIAAARADLLSLVVQEGTFRKIEDGLFVQIGERLPDGNLGQIFVADSREKNVDLAYYAKNGSVLNQNGKSMLMMFDGVINRKTPDGDVSVIHFTSYAFDLAEFTNVDRSDHDVPEGSHDFLSAQSGSQRPHLQAQSAIFPRRVAPPLHRMDSFRSSSRSSPWRWSETRNHIARRAFTR